MLFCDIEIYVLNMWHTYILVNENMTATFQGDYHCVIIIDVKLNPFMNYDDLG